MMTPAEAARAALLNGKPRQETRPATPESHENPSKEVWETPIPLVETPTVAPFPLEVFPEGIRRFAGEAARAIGCPADFVGLSILAVAGGAIGSSRALEVKAQWVQKPLLYAAVVSQPGDGKSPAIDLVARPLYQVQQQLKIEYDAALEEFNKEMAEYQQLKKEQKDAGANKPERPILQRCQVDDATPVAKAASFGASALVPRQRRAHQ